VSSGPRFERRLSIAREAIAHLNGGRELGVTLSEQVGEVFASVLLPGEKQRDLVLIFRGHDAGFGAREN
jgi:hypothetical protein